MSIPNPLPPSPAGSGPPAKPAPAAVIRRVESAEETSSERLMRKQVPAWVVSGAIHLSVIALAAVLFAGRTAETKQPEKVLATTVEKDTDTPDKDLTNEDPGLESNLAAAIPDLDRIDNTVDALVTDDPVGVPDAKSQDTVALKDPGVPSSEATSPGATGEAGPAMTGGSGDNGNMSASMVGRSGATKSKLIREGGGNEESERAVARGLAYLARQQKQNGSWVYDGTSNAETIAATGMALLPFLAAGETHKAGKRYAQTVDRGLRFLISNMNSAGKFNSPNQFYMYTHGIAAIALCEAYGMTKDKGFLLRPAQSAINFIVSAQAADGSWGYQAGLGGDTSIVGWQVQALKAAQLTKDIVVPDATVNKAISFLDKVASGSRKAVYGYTAPNGGAGTALTAVGLLCRYYVSKWGPGNAGLAEGVDGLLKRGPATAPTKPDMYYYYYATQVVHFNEGPEWKDWNEGPMKDGKRVGGMRDWLINLQNKKEGANLGSWDADAGTIGGSCGRIGSTALSLLTLEVYYRHLPLYKREGAGRVLDGAK